MVSMTWNEGEDVCEVGWSASRTLRCDVELCRRVYVAWLGNISIYSEALVRRSQLNGENILVCPVERRNQRDNEPGIQDNKREECCVKNQDIPL